MNSKEGLPPVTVSVGIVHGTQADDMETLLSKGDAAMYESKSNGKNTYTFYEQES